MRRVAIAVADADLDAVGEGESGVSAGGVEAVLDLGVDGPRRLGRVRRDGDGSALGGVALVGIRDLAGKEGWVGGAEPAVLVVRVDGPRITGA